MSLNALFNLSTPCAIYKLKTRTSQGKYGMPGEVEHYYDSKPDYPLVECYFKKLSETIIDKGPNKVIQQTYKILFPPEANLSINDKVVWNGNDYYLESPENKFNEFISVQATREKNL